MPGAQVHYEVWSRRKPGSGWTLEMALEDRGRAISTAEELLASGMAIGVRVSKETLDEETREFKSVSILNKGEAKDSKPKKTEPLDPLCVSPSDLYTVHAREVIGRLLNDWLARRKVTPFELLHRADLIEDLEAAGMDLQHAIQKIAVPEAQDRGANVHEVMRHYHRLVEQSAERVLHAEKNALLCDFAKESFADAAVRLCGNPERHFLLGAGVARALADASSWSEKVNRLLTLADSAPPADAPRTLAFQVLEICLSEILGSRGGLSDLLGPDLDLGGSLAAMTRLAAADTVELLVKVEPVVVKVAPALAGAAERLALWLQQPQFEAVRVALGQRILRELITPRRLRPEDPVGEIEVLRALAMCLTAASGKLMPLEQVQEAFVERSRLLVRGDFVEVYLNHGRSALQEVEALIWLAENVTGVANKRSAARWISANVCALRFETDVRKGHGSPFARLTALANLQRAVGRVGLIPEELSPIQLKLGEIGGWVEADGQLISQLAKAAAPLPQKITLLSKLALGETAPLGPAADRARQEVIRMMRSPEARSVLGKDPDLLGKVRDILQAGGLAA